MKGSLWVLALCLVDVAAQSFRVFSGHAGRVTGCAYTDPTVSEFVTTSSDGTARLWLRTNRVALRNFTGHAGAVNGVSVNPTQTRDFVTASTDTTLRRWDKTSGALLMNYTGHGGAVSAVAHPFYGGEFASASQDGTCRVWNSSTGSVLALFADHASPVLGVAYNPWNSSQVFSVAQELNVRVWHPRTGVQSHIYVAPTGITGIAVSPRVPNEFATCHVDGSVAVWNRTNATVRYFRGHTGVVSSVVYNSAGTQLLSAGADGTAIMWDVLTGTVVQTFRGHSAAVLSAAFHPQSPAQIITASSDATVRVWSFPSETPTMTPSATQSDTFSNLTDYYFPEAPHELVQRHSATLATVIGLGVAATIVATCAAVIYLRCSGRGIPCLGSLFHKEDLDSFQDNADARFESRLRPPGNAGGLQPAAESPVAISVTPPPAPVQLEFPALPTGVAGAVANDPSNFNLDTGDLYSASIAPSSSEAQEALTVDDIAVSGLARY